MTTVAYYKDCLIADTCFIDNTQEGVFRKLKPTISKIYNSKCNKIAFTFAGGVKTKSQMDKIASLIIAAIKKNTYSKIPIAALRTDQTSTVLVITKTNTYSCNLLSSFSGHEIVNLCVLNNDDVYVEGTGAWYFITAAKAGLVLDKIMPFVSSLDKLSSNETTVVKRSELKAF